MEQNMNYPMRAHNDSKVKQIATPLWCGPGYSFRQIINYHDYELKIYHLFPSMEYDFSHVWSRPGVASYEIALSDDPF